MEGNQMMKNGTLIVMKIPPNFGRKRWKKTSSSFELQSFTIGDFLEKNNGEALI